MGGKAMKEGRGRGGSCGLVAHLSISRRITHP